MTRETLGVNPWLSIWVKPRETIRKIIEFNPRYRFIILSFLYGLPALLHSAQSFELGQHFGILGIVTVAIVFAIFIGMLGITIGSFLIHWTGKWIGGKGEFLQVRSAIAWSNVPNILSIIMWAILIYTFKEEAFVDGMEDLPISNSEMTLISWALITQSVVAIWSFVILVKGLGEVQGFSAWKGVLNVLIPFFLVGIVIWVVSWLFWVLSGLLGGS